jgi:hypothetical protein
VKLAAHESRIKELEAQGFTVIAAARDGELI